MNFRPGVRQNRRDIHLFDGIGRGTAQRSLQETTKLGNIMKLAIGSIIRIDGWVMLSGLDYGLYRVASVGTQYGRDTYSFARPNGRKILARHYADGVDYSIKPHSDSDLNKIVVIQ
jgi:hypothetical protein